MGIVGHPLTREVEQEERKMNYARIFKLSTAQFGKILPVKCRCKDLKQGCNLHHLKTY